MLSAKPPPVSRSSPSPIVSAIVRHSTCPSDASGIGALRTSKSLAAKAPVGSEAMITWRLSLMATSSLQPPVRS